MGKNTNSGKSQSELASVFSSQSSSPSVNTSSLSGILKASGLTSVFGTNPVSNVSKPPKPPAPPKPPTPPAPPKPPKPPAPPKPPTPAPSSANSSALDNVRLSSPANFAPGPFVPSSPAVASVTPVPAIPQPLPIKEDKSIKSASPDIILVDQNDLPVDLILKLTLEKIGAQELISLVRHDLINGQNIVYQPVKNISDIAISYNPQNIISVPDTAEIYFKNFAIKMENHIVQDTNEAPPESVYIDSVSGNIVIETINLKADYEVEIQMIASGQIFDDTIYEEDVS